MPTKEQWEAEALHQQLVMGLSHGDRIVHGQNNMLKPKSILEVSEFLNIFATAIEFFFEMYLLYFALAFGSK